MSEWIKRVPRYNKHGEIIRHDLYLCYYVGHGKTRRQKIKQRLGSEPVRREERVVESDSTIHEDEIRTRFEEVS